MQYPQEQVYGYPSSPLQPGLPQGAYGYPHGQQPYQPGPLFTTYGPPPAHHPAPLPPAPIPHASQAGHVVHVPVFRSKKKIHLRRQHQGCCGVLNAFGWCDQVTGLSGFKQCNIGGKLRYTTTILILSQGASIVKMSS